MSHFLLSPFPFVKKKVYSPSFIMLMLFACKQLYISDMKGLMVALILYVMTTSNFIILIILHFITKMVPSDFLKLGFG